MKLTITVVFSFIWIIQANAVTMSEAFSKCYSNGRKLCPNLGHDSKMQDCMNQHFKELAPNCQKIIERLNRGEKITLF